jgi:elongation factor Ts
MVEVNSETDFVGKNDQFQGFVRDVTQVALAGSDLATIEGAPLRPATGGTVVEKLTSNIATIGENQSLRRA